MRSIDTKAILQESLTQLADTPDMRPFLFRTRFERSMIRLSAYAEDRQQYELLDLANRSLNKMRAIVDKSNTTADGELNSYRVLIDDIRTILSCIA